MNRREDEPIAKGTIQRLKPGDVAISNEPELNLLATNLVQVYDAVDTICKSLEVFESRFKRLGLKPLVEMSISEKVNLAELVLAIKKQQL